MEHQPRAEYYHCCAHNLILVIVSSCKQVPDIHNLFDSLRTLTLFLGASAKRKVILRRHFKAADISSLLIEQDVLLKDMSESDKLITKSSAKQVPQVCKKCGKESVKV